MEATNTREDVAHMLLTLKYGDQKIIEKNSAIQEDCIDQKLQMNELKNAVKNNDLNLVKNLLSNKVLTTNAKIFNLLKLALKRNYSNVFLELFKHITLDDNKKSCNLDKLLYYAAKLENEKPLEALVNYNVNVCTVNKKNKTPLHIAVKNKNKKLLDILLKVLMKNASDLQNIIDKEGLSLFHIICTGKNSNYVVKFLETVNISINDKVLSTSKFCPGYNALHFAVAYYKFDTVKILIERGADLDARTSARISMLHLACKMTNLNWMLYEALPDDPSSERRIYEFSKNLNDLWLSRWNIIELLFEKGCNPDARDKCGNNALMYAVNMDYELYPYNFVDEKFHCTAEERRYMLHPSEILLHKQLRTIRLILKQYDPNILVSHDSDGVADAVKQVVNFRNNLGFTCLHHLASSKCSEPKLTKILFNYGAELNVFTNEFVSPLHLAANNSASFIITSVLNFNRCNLDQIVNIDVQDDFGDTPLHYCYTNEYCYSSYNFMVLLDFGADANIDNEKGKTVFSLFCQDIFDVMLDDIFPSQVDMYEELVENFNIDFLNSEIDFHSRYSYIISGKVNVKSIAKIWKYVKKLEICKRYNDASNQNFLEKVSDKIHVKVKSIELKEKFIRSCEEEVTRLKEIRINYFISLYDILNQNINKVAAYTKNEMFKQIIELEDFEEKYPFYGKIVKARFVRASARYKLLGNAIKSLQNLIEVDMPESCLDSILSFLTEKKLRDIIEASKLIKSGNTNKDLPESYEPSRKIAKTSRFI